MPSARDLLQQADVLMRRNRTVGKESADEDVPVLTDVAVAPANSAAASSAPDEPESIVHYRDERIPVLTNVVADFEIEVPKDSTRARFPGSRFERSMLPVSEMPPLPLLPEASFDESHGEPSVEQPKEPASVSPPTEMPSWLEPNLLDPPKPSPGAGAGYGAVVETQTPPEGESPSDASSAGSASVAAPADAAAAELAETVYYQVLQNLDLYTERALQEHLTRHLAPIIERAGEELLSTLNANLGAVIRQYVAEAIEKQLGTRPAVDDR